MAEFRTLICDCCGKTTQEAQAGKGFPGWFGFTGVVFHDSENPTFCPKCKTEIMNFVVALHLKRK